MKVDDLSGTAIARRGGVVVAERIAGLADRDLGVACGQETRFQIASVSEHFTAAAVLLLASRSKLSLEDPVSRWFDNCPRDWEAITIHHQLTHMDLYPARPDLGQRGRPAGWPRHGPRLPRR